MERTEKRNLKKSTKKRYQVEGALCVFSGHLTRIRIRIQSLPRRDHHFAFSSPGVLVRGSHRTQTVISASLVSFHARRQMLIQKSDGKLMKGRIGQPRESSVEFSQYTALDEIKVPFAS